MTDKEFKRLSRSQLIDIIYQLQLKQKELIEENLMLKEELADKRIRLRKAGNIAEASLSIHKVLEAAQEAAAQYLEEVRVLRAETEAACRAMLENAKQEADTIIEHAERYHTSYDSDIEAILKEYKEE
jgi:cell division septum initiation protein DivIVA